MIYPKVTRENAFENVNLLLWYVVSLSFAAKIIDPKMQTTRKQLYFLKTFREM